MNRIFRNTIFYLLIFLVVIGIVSYFNGSTQKTTSVSYDKFITKLESGEVRNVQLQPKNGVFEVKGQFNNSSQGEQFVTYAPNTEELQKKINDKAKGAEVKYQPAEETSAWVTFFTSIIPFVIIFILFFFLLNQAQGGGSRVMNFGKSKAKLYNDEKKKFVSEMLLVRMKRNKNLLR